MRANILFIPINVNDNKSLINKIVFRLSHKAQRNYAVYKKHTKNKMLQIG